MRGSRTVVVAAACLALAACGSGGGSGSNDNGVALRFSGVFQETQEQVAPAADTFPDDETSVGDTGGGVILGQTTTVPGDINADGDLDGGFLGLENNMDQSVNVQHVNVKIFIQGAKIGNPVVTDSVPLAWTSRASGRRRRASRRWSSYVPTSSPS